MKNDILFQGQTKDMWCKRSATWRAGSGRMAYPVLATSPIFLFSPSRPFHEWRWHVAARAKRAKISRHGESSSAVRRQWRGSRSRMWKRRVWRDQSRAALAPPALVWTSRPWCATTATRIRAVGESGLILTGCATCTELLSALRWWSSDLLRHGHCRGAARATSKGATGRPRRVAGEEVRKGLKESKVGTVLQHTVRLWLKVTFRLSWPSSIIRIQLHYCTYLVESGEITPAFVISRSHMFNWYFFW